MSRKKVPRGPSRGSEKFTEWLAETSYSIDDVASFLSVRTTSIYALRAGYWRPGLDLALLIEQLTADAVGIRDWTKPARKQTQARFKKEKP